MMEKRCCVKKCSNTYERTKNLCVIDAKTYTITVITYHSFPKEHNLRQRWIEATGMLNWEPTPEAFICSEHFRESDYETLKSIQPEDDENPTKYKRILRNTAVPTLQLDWRLELKKFSSSPKNKPGNSQDISESHISANENGVLSNGIDLSIVKNEPSTPEDFKTSSHNLPFMITSAVTVKEEEDYEERHNGFDESSIMPNPLYFSPSKHDRSPDSNLRKRVKHQDSLIAPEDVKSERLSPSFDNTLDYKLTIEDKYEMLLDNYLQLKRDYDLLKFRFDRQSEAISECERIFRECR